MNPTNEQYDPDGDVSRFLDSPDLPEETVLSPLPLSPQEVLPYLPPSLPQEALQHLPLSLPQEALQQTPPLFPQEAFQQMLPPLTQEALHQQTPLFPQEVYQQTLPPLTQEGFQQMPLLPQEALQQNPLLLPQEGFQQNQGFDGTNIVSADMETVVTEPLSVEGVIITAMESIQIEGSSSTDPSDEVPYEPIFHRYLPGQRDCGGCITLREVSHSSPNRKLIFTVHGGIGTFDHAVFDVEYFGRDKMPSTRELFYVDLSMRSYNWVRSFIVGCVTLLQTDATATVQDSLSSFYDTLCADMNTTTMDEILSVDLGSWFGVQDSPDFEIGEPSYTKEDIFESTDSNFNLPVMPGPTAAIPNLIQIQNPSFELHLPAMAADGSSSSTAIVIPETPQAAPVERTDTSRRSSGNHLALQRQRTANMRLHDLAHYLHLSIADAAKKLKVCSTALKHVCRRNGLERWPSRQIQALDRQIAKLEKDIYKTVGLSATLDKKERIERLQRKKAAIYEKVFQDWKDNNGGA